MLLLYGAQVSIVVMCRYCVLHICFLPNLFRSRSGSYTPRGIFKNTALIRTSFRGSFSRKNEQTLIGMDSDSIDREQTTFQMVPVSTKQSNVTTLTMKLCISFCLSIGKRSRSGSPTPISLKDFSVHVAAMHRGKNHGFEIEYEVCVAIYKSSLHS